jgi:O-antigen ligase
VLAVGALAVWAGLAVDPRRLAGLARGVRSSWSLWAWATLGGLALLSTLTSVAAEQSIVGGYAEYDGLVRLLLASSVGVGAAALVSEDETRGLLFIARAVTAGLVVITAYALLQHFGIDFVAYAPGFDVSRVRSTLGNASNLGVYLLIALPLAGYGLAVDRRRPWRILAGVALAAGGTALVLTGSRGAWAGAAVAAFAWLALTAWRARVAGDKAKTRALLRGMRVSVIVLLVVAIAAAAIVAGSPALSKRARAGLSTGSGTVHWRVVVWHAALDMAKDRPLLGWGPGTFRFVYPAYRPLDLEENLRAGRETTDAHNVVINAGATLGLPAAAVLLVAMALTGRAVIRWGRGKGRDQAAFVGAALAGAGTALMFHFPTLDTAPALGVLLGLVAAGEAGIDPRAPESAGERSNAGRDASVGTGDAALLQARTSAALATVAAVITLAVALVAAGLTAGDIALGRGLALARAGAPWTDVARELDRARALAPWEPAFDWVAGRAAAESVRLTAAKAALADGSRYLDSAARRLPLEVGILGDEGDLHLSAGLALGSRTELAKALDAFDRAIARDRNNSMYWVGRGGTLLGLRRADEAAAAFESATRLVPTDRNAWRGLAAAYDMLGRQADAQLARARAEGAKSP